MRTLWVRAVMVGVGVASAAAPRGRLREEVPKPSPAVSAVVAPVGVVVVPPASAEGHRWGIEASGHVAVLVEAMLSEAPGVVAQLEGASPPPGLAGTVAPGETSRKLALRIRLDGDALEVDAMLCTPEGSCVSSRSAGARVHPEAAVAALVQDIAAGLGRPVPVEVAVQGAAETMDDYASLVLGRAGAVVSGLRAPVVPEAAGDVRRDPIARAVFLDPAMPTGQALLARTTTDPGVRLQAARRAVQAQPWSVARAADLAAALAGVGLREQALEMWRSVGARARGDARFVVPRAEAALAVERPDEARRVIAELEGGFRDTPQLAALEVAIADALGGAGDDLLARWQGAAADDPEPVRRRVAIRVAGSRLEEALGLIGELASRGAEREARRLTVALASDLGRWEVAAEAASELGARDVARRIEAAGAGPERIVEVLADASAPEARLARAEALLELGYANEALRVVRAVLSVEPWWPEALAVESRSLAGLGDAAGADLARARLLHADPLFFERTP